MSRKLRVAIVIVLLLAGVLSVTASALDFTDVNGHWAQKAIDRWTNYGVLDGYPGMVFKPNNNIQRAELFKVVCSVMNYQDKADNPFSDINSGNWAYDYILKLVGAGVLNGSGGMVNPTGNITREEAFSLLARVFKVPPFADGINSFGDASDVSFWARADVGGMARAGYIKGTSGNLNPKGYLTRAEAVQLLDNIIKGYVFESESYSKDIQGLTVINTGGVTFRDMVVNGDLYITQGVKSGTVTLDNVIVNGNLYVTGGGSGGGSVLLRGNTRANDVYVSSTANATDTAGTSELMAASPLKFSVSSPAEVQKITVEDRSKPVTIEGTVQYIEIGTDATAIFSNATIGQVTMDKEFGHVRINQNARITKLYCNAPRSDVYANGSVELTYVYNTAKGTRIDTGRDGVMTEIQSWADDFTASGNGRISFIFVNGGVNNRITVPGTIVSVDKGAGEVITGDGPEDVIKPGDTGQVGKPGLENALNVTGVAVTGTNTIEVQFSKTPDPLKGASPKNYSLSGDARSLTKNQTAYPDFVEISGTKAILTYSNATFSALVTGQTAIVTISGFSASDGSPIGVDSGIYRVPSDDATLKSGTLAGIAITGVWTGGPIGDGGSPLAVTIPKRLAKDATLELNMGEKSSTVKLYITSSTGAAPTSEAQYSQTKLTGLDLSDGDKIYIEVTAPNAITKKYYKLTVNVIAAPALTSIYHEDNIVRFNFADLDQEDRMLLYMSTSGTDISSATNWQTITKTATDGTGHTTIYLDNGSEDKLVKMITSDLQVGQSLYVGTYDGGPVKEIKQLNVMGVNSSVGQQITSNPESVFYKVEGTNNLTVHGLSPSARYLTTIKYEGTGKDLIRVYTTNQNGVLDLKSQSGVKDVVVQRILETSIEVPYRLGKPIMNMSDFKVNFSQNSFTKANMDESNYSLLVGGKLILLGVNAPTGSEALATANGTEYNFTSRGLQRITELGSGTHGITVKGKDASVYRIPTKLADITVNNNLNNVSGKFVAANEVQLNGGSISSGSRMLLDVKAAGVDKISSHVINTASVNNKVRFSTGSSYNIKYDDLGYSHGFAYAVTENTISIPATVNKWKYELYKFDGSYTISTATSFSTTNKVLNMIKTETLDGNTVKTIQVDGESFLAPSDGSTLYDMINGSLKADDSFSTNTYSFVTAINASRNKSSITINPSDCANSVKVTGGASSNTVLTLNVTGTYSGEVLVQSGHVDVRELKSTDISAEGSCFITMDASNQVGVYASSVQIIPDSITQSTGDITIGSGNASATVMGATLQGSGSVMSYNRGVLTVKNALSPQIVIASNSGVTELKLDSTAADANVTTNKDIAADISNLSRARPVFTTNGGYRITFTLSKGGPLGSMYVEYFDGTISPDHPNTWGGPIGVDNKLVIKRSGSEAFSFKVTGSQDYSVAYSSGTTLALTGNNGTRYSLNIV